MTLEKYVEENEYLIEKFNIKAYLTKKNYAVVGALSALEITNEVQKYFASINDLKVNIDDRFNERVHGVNSWSKLPSNFEVKQFEDKDYKVGFGESQKEVQNRMYEALYEIIKK